VRVILGVSYDGSKFHGFAKQPHVKTIEEAIIRALSGLGVSERIQYASRTDKGVHAVFQLISINFGNGSDVYSLACMLNSNLDTCIRIHSIAVVRDNFVLYRSIKEKVYLYIAPDFGEKVSRIERAIDFMNAKPHDFSVLSKRRGKDAGTVRRVRVDFQIRGIYQYFFFKSKGFLWEQVRRTTTAIKAYGLGAISFDDFKKLLMGIPHPKGISPAPSRGLILWDIKTSIKKWRRIHNLQLLRKLIESNVKFYVIIDSKKWVFS